MANPNSNYNFHAMSTGSGEQELSTISCEPCRHKKRKCDRKVPACTLCNNCGTACSYPERGKRGMPVGYIVRLEERLAETETALFQVMANFECYKQNQNPCFHPERGVYKATLEHYGCMSKQDKIAEWDRSDLSEEPDAWQWWHHRNNDVVGIRLSIGTPDLNAGWNRPSGSSTATASYDKPLAAQHHQAYTIPVQQAAPSIAVMGGPLTTDDSGVPDRLKNLDTNKYF